MKKTIAVSGGFDPLHIGHLRMVKEASEKGDLVVILNNDNWLNKKKGFVFMPEQDRAEIIKEIKGVKNVFLSKHPEDPEDMSVCYELLKLKPDIFANGGDRKAGNIPEYNLCEEQGIEMIFNIGGEKLRSSSELVKKQKF